MNKFLHCLKKMKNNIHHSSLRKSIGRANVKKIIFYDQLNLPYLYAWVSKLKEQGIIVDGICMPDEAINQLAIQFDGDLIKLSDLPHYSSTITIFIIYNTMWTSQFIEMFARWGINDTFKTVEINYQGIYNALYEHIEELYEVYDMLSGEDSSRDTFLSVLLARVSGDIRDFVFEECPQYFINDYSPQVGNTIIDGGAYDGFTAYHFMASMNGEGKVYAFEMDSDNYNKALVNVGESEYSNNIVVENLGLGSNEFQLSYTKGGTSSHVDMKGNTMANIIDLDTYVYRKKVSKVDLIKLDVEGSEMESLRGAKQVIVEGKPIMQVCLYHTLNDLWEIPLYLKRLNPNYEFSLRHHYVDGRNNYVKLDEWQASFHIKYNFSTNYKTFGETVLYCKSR